MKFFDIEANGLLPTISRVHCLVIKCGIDGTRKRYVHEPTVFDRPLEEGLRVLMKASENGEFIVGHNIIKYDIPAIQKLYPWFRLNPYMVRDTLVISRLIFSDMGERDNKLIALNKKRVTRQEAVEAHAEDVAPWDDIDVDRSASKIRYREVVVQEEAIRFPTKLWGRHSLEAWGWRLGIHKGSFEAEDDNPDKWAVFTPEMLEYCEQDVEVLFALYSKLTSKPYSEQAIELEHLTCFICAHMERSGWPFNVQEAAKLYATLVVERDSIRRQMLETFEPIVIKRVSEKTGKPLKDKVIEFNPGSRKQIAERLTAKYGWKPKEFTEGGSPKVDEDVLKKLAYPEAQLLAKYFLLEKRIGQIAEGDAAWLKCERNGHIHGSINTNGAVTGRCTHASPNLAQVPSVRAVWGVECRRLFTVRDGFQMVGADLSGLELRCLAHFMSRWDGGAYADVVLNGDVHWVNTLALGLYPAGTAKDEDNVPGHKHARGVAKTFIYAFLYGAGDEKIGSVVGKGRQAGKKLKETFLKSLPALAKLKAAVSTAAERGHLIGLDGRKVPVRSAHAALNTLLQGAGALISKRWVIEVWLEAERRGYRYGWDGDFTMLGYVHDEIQFAVRNELAEEFGRMAVECARRAGEYFNFKCPIDAEFKTGKNWYDTH